MSLPTTFTVINYTPDTIINNISGILSPGGAKYSVNLDEKELDIIVKSGLSLISSDVNLGTVGPIGPIGPIGLTGPTPWQVGQDWASGVAYTNQAPASLVYYNNMAYVCKVPHTSTGSFDGTKWVLVAVQGQTGPIGQQGIQGIQGVTPWALLENYASGRNYTNVAPASLVVYNGDVYVCTTAHTSTATFDGTKWIKALGKGLTGDKGDTGFTPFKSLVPWASGQTYTNVAPASYVSINGSSYVCTTAHTSTGIFDATKWGLVASKGDTGGQGIQGGKGDTGPAAWKIPVNWVASTAYTNIAPADTVYYLGSSYVCIIAHTSTSTFDGSKFQLIASKGDPADPSSVDDAAYMARIRG